VYVYIYIKRLHCFLLALTPLHFTNEKMKILNVHLFVKMNPALSARMTACFQVISQVKDDVCVCVCAGLFIAPLLDHTPSRETSSPYVCMSSAFPLSFPPSGPARCVSAVD